MENALDAGASEYGFGSGLYSGWSIVELLSVETQVVAGTNYRIVADLTAPAAEAESEELSGAYTFDVFRPFDELALPYITAMAETDPSVLD